MATYSSDSDNDYASTSRLFGRQRPIHSVLGGGRGTNFNFSLQNCLSLLEISNVAAEANPEFKLVKFLALNYYTLETMNAEYSTC